MTASGPSPFADGLICPVACVRYVTVQSDAGNLSNYYLCVGAGPLLRVYILSSKTLLPNPCNSSIHPPALEEKVFPVSVHGIEMCPVAQRDFDADACLILHGNRFVAVTKPLEAVLKRVNREDGTIVALSRSFLDWVLATKTVNGTNFVLVALAHGAVHIADVRTLETRWVLPCSHVELFWSMSLEVVTAEPRGCSFETRVDDGDENVSVELRVAAGTSFGQIVLWRPCISDGTIRPTIGTDARLVGHDGPVMRIVFSEDKDSTWLASGSVDRSVRLWKRCFGDGDSFTYEQYAAFYGHTSRVWQVALCPRPPEASKADGETGNGKTGLPPKLVSVSEDRSLRVWDGANSDGLPQIFYDHSGRNVWAVDILNEVGEGAVHIATGGDDGMVHLRSLDSNNHDYANNELGVTAGENDDVVESYSPLDTVVETRGHQSLQTRPLQSNGIDSSFPRLKLEGRADEAVQAVAWNGPSDVYVTTSYGRVLWGTPSSKTKWTWTERMRYRAPCGREENVAFAPNTMEIVDGHIFMGTNDGHVVCCEICHGPLVPLSFAAFGDDRVPQFVSDIFCFPSSCTPTMDVSGAFDIFASCFNGSVYHWRVRLPVKTAKAVAVYTQECQTLFGQVTAVFKLPSEDDVLVGNRRGCIRLYRGKVSQQVTSYRPHNDRISRIALASSVVKEEIDLGVDGKTTTRIAMSIITVGFDGRVVESHVRLWNDGRADCASVACAASTRCEERMTTFMDVKCMNRSSGVESSLANSRPIAIAFRASILVIYCVSSHTPLLRVNVGGWRRAFAVFLDTDHRGDGQEVVNIAKIAFWRGGALRISSMRPAVTATLGTSFHGLRTHAAAVIGTDILTASEDTTIRVTSLANGISGELWQPLQILSAHTSSVTCISTVILPDGTALAVSGGGMDELMTWKRPTAEAAWTLAHRHTPRRRGGATAPDSQPRHRIMCVDVRSLDGYYAPISLVGRSDGSVTLSIIGPEKATDVCYNAEVHGGAVLSCAWSSEPSGSCGSTVDGPVGAYCVTGDSSGRICLWCVVVEANVLSLNLVTRHDGTHSAGVNDVALCGGFIASAGDDEALVVRRFDDGVLCGDGGRFGAAGVGVCSVWEGEGYVGVGADQRVVLGKTNGGVVEICKTAVADPAGVEVLTEKGTGRIQVVIFGMGMETLWIGGEGNALR